VANNSPHPRRVTDRFLIIGIPRKKLNEGHVYIEDGGSLFFRWRLQRFRNAHSRFVGAHLVDPDFEPRCDLK
jgi:hypothetical protein